jgi:hypothetical protein
MYSIKKIISGAFTGLALYTAIISGCKSPEPRNGNLVASTNYQRPAVKHNSNGIDNIQLTRTTNSDVKYHRRKTIINGLEMYVEPNLHQKKGELDFLFIPENEVHIRRGIKTTKETSKFVYIPTVVENLPGVPKTEIKLNPSGKYGVKASIRRHPVDQVQSGYVDEFEGDVAYNIKSQKIADRIWRHPKVEESLRGLHGALDFYLTQRGLRNVENPDGTKEKKDITILDIDRGNGNIVLINNFGEIFRPLQVYRTEYEARSKVETPSSGSPGEAIDSTPSPSTHVTTPSI